MMNLNGDDKIENGFSIKKKVKSEHNINNIMDTNVKTEQRIL